MRKQSMKRTIFCAVLRLENYTNLRAAPILPLNKAHLKESLTLFKTLTRKREHKIENFKNRGPSSDKIKKLMSFLWTIKTKISLFSPNGKITQISES
jgi:hypothetical protein